MNYQTLASKLKDDLVPKALSALEHRLDSEEVSPADIRLVFDLLAKHKVDLDNLESAVEKTKSDPTGLLTEFTRASNG